MRPIKTFILPVVQRYRSKMNGRAIKEELQLSIVDFPRFSLFFCREEKWRAWSEVAREKVVEGKEKSASQCDEYRSRRRQLRGRNKLKKGRRERIERKEVKTDENSRILINSFFSLSNEDFGRRSHWMIGTRVELEGGSSQRLCPFSHSLERSFPSSSSSCWARNELRNFFPPFASFILLSSEFQTVVYG